jgi:pyruvate formate lyase activating enzyme
MRAELEPHVVLGEFHSPAAEGRVRCEVCPRGCLLHDGQRAFCFVRAARGGEIVLTTYGLSSGFCVDPIEKKPLDHFLPGTAVLSFGTAGCNLGCRFCQNWDISKAREQERLSSPAGPDVVAAAAVEAGCASVAFTYNDPVVFLEYAVDTADACHARGVRTVAVTAGYITSAARPRFFAGMDAANVDLKAFSERFYHKLCFAELEPVKETLVWLARESEVWVEVTTLLIPGENDSEDEVARLCGWMVEALGPDVPLHFTAFHPDFKLTEHPPTPVSTLRRARQQALAAGLRYVYTGNVRDLEGQSTRCASCGALLIERDGYELGTWGLDDAGSCLRCRAQLPGRFSGGPGGWGSRRLPLHISSRR